MTEIATRANGAIFTPTERQASLAEWVETAKAVNQIAVGLVRTSFVPAGFKGKPEEATAAILAGHEVGLDPIASLRAFDVIQGQAAPRAMTLRAVLQSKGHRVWIEEQSDAKVIACGQRKDDDEVHRSEWTIERARRLKLDKKENWQNQPKAMLIARATAEVCRMTAADAIMGMPYSAEEMRDEASRPAPIRATATRRPRTIREAVAGTSSTATLEPEPAVTPQADDWDDPRLAEDDAEPAGQSALGAALAKDPAG